MQPLPANFDFLGTQDAQLVRLGALAERYFKDDPTAHLIKLRQLGEARAQLTTAKASVLASPDESPAHFFHRLKFDRIVQRKVAELFHQVPIAGNRAWNGLADDYAGALRQHLFIGHQNQ